MTTWRYKARDPGTMEIVCSIIQADSDAAARTALRKAGLRPIQIKPLRERGASSSELRRMLNRHLRKRRVHQKADYYDSLATLLDAGIPLAKALRTMGSSRAGQRGVTSLSHTMADAIQGGESLADAMRQHPGWFDASEIAMIDAGQRSGEMAGILQRLAERQSRAGELGAKLAGALTYPILVSVIGVGVTIFLSVKTLPELVGILNDAEIQPPGLTMAVMHAGQLIWRQWIWLICGMLVIAFAWLGALRWLRAHSRWRLGTVLPKLIPGVFLRVRTAEVMLSLAELLETGVTLVEALRVVAPTMRGVLGGLLASELEQAAQGISQGKPVSCIFESHIWFSEEHRQLMIAGEAAGELGRTLGRIGQRDLRAARRLLDRFAALIEPAAIVLLAILVGTVVMAAILPLIRLQEIIG